MTKNHDTSLDNIIKIIILLNIKNNNFDNIILPENIKNNQNFKKHNRYNNFNQKKYNFKLINSKFLKKHNVVIKKSRYLRSKS